jgi:hypothetical protein
MRHKLALALGSAILAGLAVSAGYAQDQEQKPPEQTAPSGNGMIAMTPQMQGMMGNPEMMQRMMANPEMMAQMQRMMENCNKMMESMMQQPPSPPAPEKKG